MPNSHESLNNFYKSNTEQMMNEGIIQKLTTE